MNLLREKNDIEEEINRRKTKVKNLLQGYTTMSYEDVIEYCRRQLYLIDGLMEELDCR